MSRRPVQSGAGTGCLKGGSSVPSPYTPATKVAGVEIAEPSSSAPRVPVSPLATVSHVSTSRSRNGSKPLTSKRQEGSAFGSGKLRRATISRIASWSCRMSRKRGRAAAGVQHLRRHPGRLRADADVHGAAQLGDEHRGVGPLPVHDRPERVAKHQQVLRLPAAPRHQRARHRVHGVRSCR